jgi:hypothetical protein
MSANTRMTLGALLGSITTAANTITSTFDAANKGIGMLNRTVSDASDRQNLRSKVDAHTYKTTLIREKAQEETLANLKIAEFINTSPQHELFYKDSFNTLTELLSNPN